MKKIFENFKGGASRVFKHRLFLPLAAAVVVLGSAGGYLLFSNNSTPWIVDIGSNEDESSDAVLAASIKSIKLNAVGGGDSIAVIWEKVDNVKWYKVFRNNEQVATVGPRDNTIVPAYKDGTRYIDRDIKAGETYTYSLQAVTKSGRTTPMSATASGKVQKNGMTTPSVSVSEDSDPEYASWLEDAKKEIRIWYPKISDRLAKGNYEPTKSLSIRVISAPEAVAYAETEIGRITISREYLENHKDDFGGLVIHEMTHIVQDYRGNGVFWAREGMADWVRTFFYRDPTKGARDPRGSEFYTNGYDSAAQMLAHINSKVGGSFMKDLNLSLKFNDYLESTTMKEMTEKTSAEWWQDLTGDTVKVANVRLSEVISACLNAGTSLTPSNGTRVELKGCDSDNDQQTVYFVQPKEFDFNYAHIGNKCLDVRGSGKDDGTPVQLWDCNSSPAQQWKFRTNGMIGNTNSGKCLTTPFTDAGAQLVIETCGDPERQKWDLAYRTFTPPDTEG